MKVLCLHGYGTNIAVLENQLSTIASNVNDIDFEYVNGQIESSKARGLGAFTTGPFWCYYDSFAPSKVREAHEMITEIIEDEGPFDGILGFSQGASLAVAYLLQHEIDHPGQPAPFKFALIFSSVISFTPDDSYCMDVLHGLNDEEIEKLAAFPNVDLSILSPDAKTLFGTMVKALNAGIEGGFLHAHPDPDVFRRRDSSMIPRILHPALIRERIRIPTVHVVGKMDDPLMLEQSELVFQLCDVKFSKWLEHSAGHDVPRTPEDAKAVCKALAWAADEGESQSLLCRL
ncbi:hypothetical protein OHC33_001064 [Knufia fluminis]|uniref:Serine hydrolase domain-containing protein n=1 Tax=Knufia fluminis TaxID=191047 RepID=A0AAN8IBY7_9EURO|nr:hypothetical protein OHC33_001064 [Knufia fluminis]